MDSLSANLNTIIVDNMISDEEVFEFISNITSVDRYQASDGIAKVAEMIKKKLDNLKIGLTNLQRCYSPEKIKAWTFDGMESWDPECAHFKIINDPFFNLEYNETPFLLATNSAEFSVEQALSECIINPNLSDNLENKIVFTTKAYISQLGHLDFLLNSNIAGIITDFACKHVGKEQYNGRLELPSSCKSFAFSITSDNMNYLLDKKKNDNSSAINIKIKLKSRKNKFMPLLDYIIPGVSNKEIWIISHLCHGRPGANDNASGNLTLFMLAKLFSALSKQSLGHTLRFIWMPEFIGTAVYLHEFINKMNQQLPILVINCDMIARAKEHSDSFFILEDSPLHVPSIYSSLVKESVQIVGKLLDHINLKFETGYFKGQSDHLLFVDSYLKIPAVQYTEQPDPYNHSSGDTFLNYDFIGMKSSILVIYTAIHMLACPLEDKNKNALIAIICDWKIQELKGFLMNDIINKLVTHGNNNGINIAKEFLYRIKYKSLVASILDIKNFHSKVTLNDLNAVFLSIKKATQVDLEIYKKHTPEKSEMKILRLWEGPFNLRATLNTMSSYNANKFKAQISLDKSMYSKIVTIAVCINNIIGKTELWATACLSINEVIDLNFFEQVLSSLENIGWITYTYENKYQSIGST